VIALQDRLRTVENDLKRYKVQERLNDMEALTTADKTALLECSVV
jgi:hypothetical protein